MGTVVPIWGLLAPSLYGRCVPMCCFHTVWTPLTSTLLHIKTARPMPVFPPQQTCVGVRTENTIQTQLVRPDVGEHQATKWIAQSSENTNRRLRYNSLPDFTWMS
jgi:hypothetical protein